MTIAAHQLRTPLTGLLWSIEALLDPKTDQGAKAKLMTDVDGLLKRMRLIINHLLASANVEGGRFGYVFEKIDVAPIIEKLIGEFKPVSDDHGVSISFAHPDAAFPVYADQERITLALFDLIENAIDYTPRGGSITVSLAPVGTRMEVAIQDTGIGISESEIPSLFGRFYRSDRARRMRPDGSGLGLFLVKNIIASHGSDITVTSKEGSGSRFSFYLDSEKKPQA
jgi:signal transduction histidine kinase